MAYFDTNLIAGKSTTPTLFARLSAAMQRRRTYRQTYTELSTLGERELEDLGITRGDIEHTARRAAGYL